MATSADEFIDLAAELIGDEFAAFASDALFERGDDFDYDTQTYSAPESQTKKCIRLEYDSSQIEGLIAVGDYMLIAEYQLFDWEPSPDDTFVTFGGVKSQIKKVTVDPASATIILQVRPL